MNQLKKESQKGIILGFAQEGEIELSRENLKGFLGAENWGNIQWEFALQETAGMRSPERGNFSQDNTPN